MNGPNTFLVLAGYTFQELEVPPNIKFGTELVKKVHQLPGGIRRVDAMTSSDHDLEWDGLFFGPDASANARAMQSIMKSAQPVDLDWWDLSYSVLITNFEITFERYFQVGYKITCTVINDNSLPPLPGGQQSVDDFMNGDGSSVFAGAEDLGMSVPGTLPGPVSSAIGITIPSLSVTFTPGAFGIDLTPVADALTTLRSALVGTPSFSGIASDQLAIVNSALAGSSDAIGDAIKQIEKDIAAAPGVAGMVSGQDDPTVFQEIMAEAGQEAQLLPMEDYLTRMEYNAGAGSV